MIFPYNTNRSTHMKTLQTYRGEIVKTDRVVFTTNQYFFQSYSLKKNTGKSYCGMKNKWYTIESIIEQSIGTVKKGTHFQDIQNALVLYLY